MPELPEVATMVKAMKPRIMGRRVRHVVAEESGLLVGAAPEDLSLALDNTVVSGIFRHGKYVRIDFESAPPTGKDRAITRAPAAAASVVARRPETLEELLAPSGNLKIDRSRPVGRGKARSLFDETRVRPSRRRGPAASLLIHLKMTGRFFLMNDNGHPVPPRTRFVVSLEDDEDDMLLGMKDARRLGTVWLLIGSEAHRWPDWLELGPDAASGRLTEKRMIEALDGNLPIKLALLDQSRVAGLGNIYSCEVLFRTRIHPARKACDLSPREWSALAREIPKLMKLAMSEWCELSRWVGPAVEGYGDTNGGLMVYDREGEACRRCGEPIETMKQGGRTTFFCGGCQK